MKYGFDFGTTNSSIAIKENGIGQVLPVDLSALDSCVVRTILYFLKRELVVSNRVPLKRRNSLTFLKEELSYIGEQKVLIGQNAVDQYIEDNRFRGPAIIRKILTGRMVAPYPGANPLPEYYLDVDYGVGRFIQSMKTALKSQSFKGTSVFGQLYTLEELIGSFVGEIKNTADKQLGEKVDELIVGRPVHFSNDISKDKAAQNRLETALKLAGFKKIRFIFEPVAAAEQYLATSKNKKQLVFVFDFGGGTLDTAIVRIENSMSMKSRVLATDGTYIGGDLLNSDIMRRKLWPYFGSEAIYGDHQLMMPFYLYDSLNFWYSIPSLNNPETLYTFERLRYKNSDLKALERLVYLVKSNLGFDLYEAIESAKKQLSISNSGRIIFQNGPIDINLEITRDEFEKIIEPRIEEIKEVVLQTMRDAKIGPEQINVVVKTGGSSLIPAFENMLTEIFGKDKIKQFETFTSIAAGLALMD